MSHNFEIDKVYNRKIDIHAHYGGNQQAGISNSRQAPYIMLFMSNSASSYGYTNEWDENGVLHYTGEGRTGDMNFKGSNKALRDHAENGKNILLFEGMKSGNCRFKAELACSSFEFREGLDANGDTRKVIIFHLIDVSSTSASAELPDTPDIEGSDDLELARARALLASGRPTEGTPISGKKTYYKRDPEIRSYVLKRADGKCECCGAPAPFLKKNGAPYLEAHHTRRLSDNGLDDIRWVAAITPNCHRRIHHGQDGEEINKKLSIKIQEIEKLNSTKHLNIKSQ